MAENDIYLVRKKADGTFSEIGGYTHTSTQEQITESAYNALSAADQANY